MRHCVLKNNNVSDAYSLLPLHALDKFHSSPPKRNLVFGLLDRAYKIASTYNAIHNEFMNITSMLIKNEYPKAYLDRCIMKYLTRNMKLPLILLRKNRQ